MRAFTQKQNQPQQASSDVTRSSVVASALSRQLDPILYLQRMIGNQAVGRLLQQAKPDDDLEGRSGAQDATRLAYDLSHILPVQAKPPSSAETILAVNPSGDICEQEAERVSTQMMRMSDPEVSIAAAPPQISRECTACDEKEETLQTKPTGLPETAVGEAPGIVQEVLRSPGRPLDSSARAFFEPRFGHDFSHVRVHADPTASAAARNVAAHAFTMGQHIVFGESQYAPGSVTGRHLLAHELTHVIQQRAGGWALQRRADNCPDAPPSPPTITTIDDFIALVRRVEADASTKNDPIATARLISRTKYEGRAWDWMLPSTKGQAGVEHYEQHYWDQFPGTKNMPGLKHGASKVTADDIGSLCYKLTVSLPGGGIADPMHIIVAIVADAETIPAGTGATGLSRFVDPLPASVSQRSASTWVGDVGKAAGDWMAVIPLSKGGGTKADYMLESAPPHDLMADVDGVAMTSKSAASGFAFDKAKPLSDNLQRFFAPAKRTGRERRFHVFCSAEGFALEADGVTLTSGATKTIGQRVKDFADWYTKNDPHILKYLAVASESWSFSKTLMDRAGDWQWFADEFIKFVQKNLTAEGP